MASQIPDGAWDTHIHVFNPKKFPYATPRSYTPREFPLANYPANITGCKSIVVVHASMQGTSPAPLLDTLNQEKEFPGYVLRGLATIDVNNTTDQDLDRLHEAGVRGARMHLMAWGHGEQAGADSIVDKVRGLADKTSRLGWIIDLFCPLEAWVGLAGLIRSLDPNVKVLADHFGAAFPGDEKKPEFQTLLELIREKRLYVKLSGFERLYHGHPDGIESLTPIAKAIIAAGPTQICYGSDAPHTVLGVDRQGKSDEQRLNEEEGFREVPDEEHIRKLREWIPDDETWQKFWVENPKKLFL
jgi:predicted TIM-barrel fold metal-dependent hydrolase